MLTNRHIWLVAAAVLALSGSPADAQPLSVALTETCIDETHDGERRADHLETNAFGAWLAAQQTSGTEYSGDYYQSRACMTATRYARSRANGNCSSYALSSCSCNNLGTDDDPNWRCGVTWNCN